MGVMSSSTGRQRARRVRRSGARPPSSRASPRPRSGDALDASTGMGWRATTAESATTSRAWCRASRTSTRRIAQGPFYLPNPARERKFVTSTGKAHFAVAPISSHDLGARPVSADDHSQPRSVQHHDLRAARPLSRRARRAARALHEPGGPGGAGLVGGAAGGHHQSLPATSVGWRGGSSWCPTRSRGAVVAVYFPEANVLVPLGSVAEESNQPTYKSLHVSLEASVPH